MHVGVIVRTFVYSCVCARIFPFLCVCVGARAHACACVCVCVCGVGKDNYYVLQLYFSGGNLC